METLEYQILTQYLKPVEDLKEADFFGSTKDICEYLKYLTGWNYSESRISIALLKSNAVRIRRKTCKGTVSLWALNEIIRF